VKIYVAAAAVEALRVVNWLLSDVIIDGSPDLMF
jgi:hypothetical protein